MKNLKSEISGSSRLQNYINSLLIIWTVICLVSIFWNARQVRDNMLEEVHLKAQIAYEYTLIYRHWVSEHGGVYVQVSEKTPPNPYLKNLPERDIRTPGGKKLTLVNPAYMTRQINELAKEKFNSLSHITSLNPLRPQNAPDPWEEKALKSIKKGQAKHSSVEYINGEEYLRVLYPFITEKECLKCHGVQGYKVGDIRGGISISLPMEPHRELSSQYIFLMSAGHILLWQIVFWVIFLGGRRTIQINKKREEAEFELKLNEDRLSTLLDLTQKNFQTEQELADYALEKGVKLTQSQVGYMHFFDESRKNIKFSSWSQNVFKHCSIRSEFHYSLEKAGIWAGSARLGRPVVHNDYQGLPDREKKGYPKGHFEVIRHMSVPIYDSNEIIAIAGVGNKSKPYNKSDERQLSLYMNNMWRIMKQKRAEKSLLENESFLSNIFSSITDGITILDRSMTIIRANDAMKKWYPHAIPLEGKKCFKAYHGRDQICEICLANKTLQTGNVEYKEICLQKNDGQSVEWVDLYYFPLIDHETGDINGIVQYRRDVSEKKAIEESLKNHAERLKKANNMKDLFNDILRHDLLNPLGVIKGFTEILIEGEKNENEKNILINIDRSAWKMIDMIKTASLYSRLETIDKIDLSETNLDTVISDCIFDLTTLLEDNLMEVYFSPDGRYPARVNAIIENVFSNILSNAIKYARKGKKIQIDLVKAADNIVIAFKDWGAGIKDKNKEKIFTRFHRIHEGSVKGAGLGLAIAERIVELHNGKIWIEDNPEGGSIFKISLPQVQVNRRF